MPHAVSDPEPVARWTSRIVDRMRRRTGADVAFAALPDPAGSNSCMGHRAVLAVPFRIGSETGQ